jgi:hypothetical protein
MKYGLAPFRTKDQMHHNKRERQWHSQEYRLGLQPSAVTCNIPWDYVPSCLWRSSRHQ